MEETEGHLRRKFLQAVGGTGILATSTMLAGCSEGNGDDNTEGTDTDPGGGTETEETQTPADDQRGGSLATSLQADPDTFHPHKSHEHAGNMLSMQTTQNLLTYDHNMNLTPELATDLPEVSDDEMELTFTLHEGVMFHEPYDREMTAEDVVWNYRKFMDPDYGNFYQGNFTDRLVEDPEEAVQATGDYEVTFTQNEAWAPEIVGFLCSQPRTGILPQEAIEEHGQDYGSVSVGTWGTGPFQYVEGTSGSSYVFERNPNYWKDGLPYLDELTFEIIREASTRTSALVSGDVDYVDVLPWQDMDRVSNTDGMAIATAQGTTPGGHYTNNGGCDKFADKRVRKAMRYATNQQAIVEVQFQGNAEPMDSPLPPNHQFYEEDASVKYPHDPEQARSLLDDAGVENLSMRGRVTNQPFYMDTAEIVQQSLSNAGIELNLNPTDKSSTWSPALEGREEPVGCDSWETHIEDFLGTPPAHTYLNFVYPTGALLNVFHYSNENVDQWLKESLKASDEAERQELISNAIEQVTEDAVYNYTTYPGILQARSTRVQNSEVYPTEDLNFESVWIEA